MTLKNLRQYNSFDWKQFISDHNNSLMFLSVEDNYLYENGKRLETITGSKITVLLTAGDNEFEKLKIKLPTLSREKVEQNIKKGQHLYLEGVEARIYGDYQNNLSITATGFKILNNKSKDNQ